MLDIVLLESSTHQAAVDSLVSPSFSDNSSFYTGHHPVFTSNRPSKLQNMTWTLDDVFPQRTHIITSLLSGQCRASSDPGVASARARAVRRPWRRSVRRRGDGQRFTTAPELQGLVDSSCMIPDITLISGSHLAVDSCFLSKSRESDVMCKSRDQPMISLQSGFWVLCVTLCFERRFPSSG